MNPMLFLKFLLETIRLDNIIFQYPYKQMYRARIDKMSFWMIEIGNFILISVKNKGIFAAFYIKRLWVKRGLFIIHYCLRSYYYKITKMIIILLIYTPPAIILGLFVKLLGVFTANYIMPIRNLLALYALLLM